MKTLYELEVFLLGNRAHATISVDKGVWKVGAMAGHQSLCAGTGRTLPAACEDMLLDLRERQRSGK